jgi:hypothetical protein
MKEESTIEVPVSLLVGEQANIDNIEAKKRLRCMTSAVC